jgi:hypothetical protein
MAFLASRGAAVVAQLKGQLANDVKLEVSNPAIAGTGRENETSGSKLKPGPGFSTSEMGV